ncbi:hypothetical protein CAP35_11670 [Chitinophagaceae bacterium IBVUCB1]|nr:hypothetical protein CAP35_11670 [Chitinophagaceae bacterium IBVUCB1]
MNGRLVTIAVFAVAFQAQLLKGRLEADGIPCFIKDEHTVQVNPMLNNALGGIKLQVMEEDVPTAVGLLRYSGYRTVFDVPTEPVKKEAHILIRFGKFVLAAAVVLGWLYFVEFVGK